MNKKYILALTGIAIAVFLLLKFGRHPQSDARQISTTSSTADESKNSVVSINPASAKQASVSSILSVSNAGIEYIKKIKADPQYDWKQPINFYGLVVDENNAVVVGANIHFVWNNISLKGTSEADTTSDGNGRFSITNRRGKAMTVTVAKEGYYGRSGSYEYANPFDGLFHPDPMNPVVFHLRKKGEGADLIHGDELFGFRTNGPLQYLDLLQGKNTLNPPGDLAAQVMRTPRNPDAKFNWSVTISVPDGGILETNEEFMFEAPTDGYQPAIVIQATTNDLHWSAVAKTQFYFKSRNGNVYGRAKATIYSQYQKAAAIDLDYYVNPSGSRNLEPKSSN